MKRSADTGVLILEFLTSPPSSERANAAIARMNWQHRYKISEAYYDVSLGPWKNILIMLLQQLPESRKNQQ
jgi:hypothetical protein